MSDPVLRDAALADLSALLALEALFPGDRMRARQFRRHLRSPNVAFRVIVEGGELAGAALVFFRRGSRIARLYSLVVDPARRGRGLARRLLADAEAIAATRGCDRVRLEVRADNASAIALYESAGYRVVADLPGYYEDGGAGRRYEKSVVAKA